MKDIQQEIEIYIDEEEKYDKLIRFLSQENFFSLS